MQNSPPFRKEPPPSGWRRFRFPARTLYTATHLQRDHDRTSPQPYGSTCSTLSTALATLEQEQQKNSSRVAGRAGLPYLGTSMHVLLAVEDFQARHQTTGRLSFAYMPVPACLRRYRWPNHDMRRFQILPYVSRPLYTLAGSHSPAGHHSRDGSQSPAVACPQTITNDQGRHFESQLLNSLAIMCGINLSYTTAFQPAANGLVERMHRSIKAAILCRLQERWTKAFPLGIRKAFKDLQASVLELFFGEPLRIPGELLAAPPTTGIHQSSLHSSAPIRITVASPSGTSHIPRWLCPQGPGRLYRCLLPAGYNTAPPGNALQWPLQSLGRHTKNDAHRHKRSARQLRPTGIYPSSSRQRQMATLQPLEYPRSRQHKPHHSPAHKTQSQDSSF